MRLPVSYAWPTPHYFPLLSISHTMKIQWNLSEATKAS